MHVCVRMCAYVFVSLLDCLFHVVVYIITSQIFMLGFVRKCFLRMLQNLLNNQISEHHFQTLKFSKQFQSFQRFSCEWHKLQRVVFVGAGWEQGSRYPAGQSVETHERERPRMAIYSDRHDRRDHQRVHSTCLCLHLLWNNWGKDEKFKWVVLNLSR